ncbi:MAG: glucose-1-phosphate cytidylyltransferase [Planctomycetota bacterium]|nr:MAG: glucose-1-phosphate cytidylyltransferase [Planctomycetota bacterium]
MKVAILAGGFGSRLQEETVIRPKPMVEIGGKPILWHILNIYSAFGFNDFVLALGYKGEYIKKYFLNFYAVNNDLTVDLANGKSEIHEGKQPNWRIDLVDTGLKTMTGGRIKRLQPWVGNETFLATYGDGLSDIRIEELISFHKSHGKVATLTAVRPPARFGGLNIDGGRVVKFAEKPQSGEGWINGGFFVLEPEIFDYIDGDSTPFEGEPMQKLASDGQLMAFQHEGFFQPMDTIRECNILEDLWVSGKAPWKMW